MLRRNTLRSSPGLRDSKSSPFGDGAAVEAADAHGRALDAGDKKEGTANWAKVKYDRQIMAIAKVESADCVYSNDDDLVKMGVVKDGIPVVPLAQLPEPPAPALTSSTCSTAPACSIYRRHADPSADRGFGSDP